MTDEGRLDGLASRLLGLSARHAERVVGTELARVDAHRWHYAVLATLAERGPASQAALGVRTGIHTSDLVGLIGELVGRGEVTRGPDPADRRRNVVDLTAAGRERLHLLDAVLDDAQNELLAPLSPGRRAELVRLLRILVEHHGHPEPGEGSGVSGRRPRSG
ncbi:MULTISPECIES: MarR family winged helix-turn-helix transcriptional regulator [Pseudonocardia]|uniref:HTH-type transcriptional repressor NicR n=2 Tax=Pseudonocardia TaxID=1847 RepID=A0A1Y2MSY1_PSEAH|nr:MULTISPECIES: MarR family winged helix-turn-helix transcriptional regulator [Pseudonocardia]OSY38079.1 HTH-type transcriptional repressor NicR [Pseudonocardia autotrophica]TDN75520.1 DNA-binding MarR family transcriptional regulator [Pseudonocardia autotrophica]BBF99489.1 hypothetical protein Pdca_06990 [Pseudonocardia autotrophica]GEC28490.1 hypothetical protein PSA01_55190 [Pseudonocardia saturnea]